MREEGEEYIKEFSWSWSRAQMFERCQFQYYFHYYDAPGFLYWGGNRRKNTLYKMKHVSTAPLWIGKLLHDWISWIVRREIELQSPVPFDEVAPMLEKDMRYRWEVSARRWFPDEAKVFDFMDDHFYGGETVLQLPEEYLRKALELLQGFYNLFIVPHMGRGCRILSNEALMNFPFEGMPVYQKADLILEDENGIHLWDWKSSKSTFVNDQQMALYALAAGDKHHRHVSEMSFHFGFLANGEIKDLFIDEDVIHETEDYMRSSIKEMTDRLSNRRLNQTHRRYFEKTQTASNCKDCKFRGPCQGIPYFEW